MIGSARKMPLFTSVGKSLCLKKKKLCLFVELWFLCLRSATKMFKDVHQALLSIMETQGTMTSFEAGKFLMDLSERRKYVKEIWA